jgi:hypothetical protein
MYPYEMVPVYQQAFANQRINLSSPTGTSRNFLASLVRVEEFHQINHWTFMAILAEEVKMSWSCILRARECKV